MGNDIIDKIPEKIEIQHQLDLEELCERLRRVSLKGFPDVRVYENSNFLIQIFTPEQVKSRIFTPQPSIYVPILERIEKMKDMFLEQGIDIFRLEGGYDYISFYDNGQERMWTFIPPIVERRPIKIKAYGQFDYSNLMTNELEEKLASQGLGLNPELESMHFEDALVWMDTICDGSHRVHFAVERGLEQNLLLIGNIKEGYPYYALPKPYHLVHVEPERDDSKSDKTHVMTKPGHKFLYRLFPSGGLYTGDVRKPTTN